MINNSLIINWGEVKIVDWREVKKSDPWGEE